MLWDARRDALPSYAMRALAGAALLGGFTAFILLIAGGPLPLATKLLYASLPAIVGGAFGTISGSRVADRPIRVRQESATQRGVSAGGEERFNRSVLPGGDEM